MNRLRLGGQIVELEVTIVEVVKSDLEALISPEHEQAVVTFSPSGDGPGDDRPFWPLATALAKAVRLANGASQSALATEEEAGAAAAAAPAAAHPQTRRRPARGRHPGSGARPPPPANQAALDRLDSLAQEVASLRAALAEAPGAAAQSSAAASPLPRPRPKAPARPGGGAPRGAPPP